MSVKIIIPAVIFVTAFMGCTEEYNCADAQIQPAFIQFASSDIDTFVIRKFRPADNFQNLLDTYIVRMGNNVIYQVSMDTTTVFVTDGKNGIRTGFDWQIFIPARNKTVFISDIGSEKKTEKRGKGIFSLDPAAPCVNRIFLLKMDNQPVYFSNTDGTPYRIFIRY